METLGLLLAANPEEVPIAPTFAAFEDASGGPMNKAVKAVRRHKLDESEVQRGLERICSSFFKCFVIVFLQNELSQVVGASHSG